MKPSLYLHDQKYSAIEDDEYEHDDQIEAKEH